MVDSLLKRLFQHELGWSLPGILGQVRDKGERRHNFGDLLVFLEDSLVFLHLLSEVDFRRLCQVVHRAIILLGLVEEDVTGEFCLELKLFGSLIFVNNTVFVVFNHLENFFECYIFTSANFLESVPLGIKDGDVDVKFTKLRELKAFLDEVLRPLALGVPHLNWVSNWLQILVVSGHLISCVD